MHQQIINRQKTEYLYENILTKFDKIKQKLFKFIY